MNFFFKGSVQVKRKCNRARLLFSLTWTDPLTFFFFSFQRFAWTQSRGLIILWRCWMAQYFKLFGKNQERFGIACHVFHFPNCSCFSVQRTSKKQTKTAFGKPHNKSKYISKFATAWHWLGIEKCELAKKKFK